MVTPTDFDNMAVYMFFSVSSFLPTQATLLTTSTQTSITLSGMCYDSNMLCAKQTDDCDGSCGHCANIP